MPRWPSQRMRAQRRRKSWAAIITIAFWFAAGADAAAEDSATQMFTFGGFGTMGAVHSNEDRADFATSISKATGAGHTNQWSTDVDSLFGLQVTGTFTTRLSAIVQVISEQNYDNTYTPHVEWANIKVQLTPDASIRVGRIVLPIFLLSDSRKVQYANPWVRPPVEFYTLVPVTNSDGIDANFKLRSGSYIHNLQLTYGRSKPHFVTGITDARREWSISDTMEFGPATIRGTYLEAALTIDNFNSFIDSFRQFGAAGVMIADKYDVHGKVAKVADIGAIFDPGDWFVMGEWGKAEYHSVLSTNTAWYLSGGYRLAKFTPYVTYADVKANSSTSDPGLDVSTLPANVAGPAAGLNAALNGILGATPVQHTISVGMRWDCMRDTALKLQYDRIELGTGSPGTLSNLQPSFQRGGSVDLLSITIDFVFGGHGI
jgi:hypothetical protein